MKTFIRYFTTANKALMGKQMHHKLPNELKTAIFEPPIGEKLNDKEKMQLQQTIMENCKGYKNLQDKGSKLEQEQERVDDGVYPA